MLRLTVGSISMLVTAWLLSGETVPAGAVAGARTTQALSPKDAQDAAEQLVVMIEGTIGGERSLGAGIIFNRTADALLIVTARHVVVGQGSTEGASARVMLRMLPGEPMTARVLETFLREDLAVLKIDGVSKFERDLASLKLDRLGDAGAVQIRDEVYAIGQPNQARWEVNLVGDLVTRIDATVFAVRSAGVAPGSSGGGLFNAQRLLIGLVQKDVAPDAEAIRIDEVTRVLKRAGYTVAWQAPAATAPPATAPPATAPPATAPPATAPPATAPAATPAPEGGGPEAPAPGRGGSETSARGRRGSETPVIARPGTAAEPVWRIVGTGDFNGDGRSDLLWHNRDTNHIQSWLLNAAQIIGRPEVNDERGQRAVVGLPWTIVGTGDFNGDGRVDILWHNRDTNHVQAWFLNGVTIIGRAEVDDERGQRVAVGLPWRIVGTGDFNGDRKVDILWHNRDTNHVQAWFLNGVAIIGRAEVDDERGQRVAVGLPWSIVGAGDFNGDRKTDILWHNRDTNNTQIWLLDGMKIAGRANVDDENGLRALVGLPWSIVGALDFSGDGRTDILWHNRDTNRVQAWLLSGARIAGRPEIDDK